METSDTTASFAAAFESAPIATAVLAPNLAVIVANVAFERAWNCTREDIVGQNLVDLVTGWLQAGPPAFDELDRLRASLGRVLVAGLPDETQIPTVAAAGESVQGNGKSSAQYWRAIQYPILDSERRVTHVVHQLVEPTQLAASDPPSGGLGADRPETPNADRSGNHFQTRFTEAADSESEKERRMYHTALSNTPDLVYVFDLNHRFLYANEALLDMWGRTWDDAIGKNCLELGYEPWHAEMHDREIDEVVATRQPIRGEVPFTGTKGRRIYDYIFVPVLGADGTVEAIAGTTRDVTERKEAEDVVTRLNIELARRLRELQTIFETAPVGINVADDPDCKVIRGNGVLLEMVGMPYGTNLSKSAPDAEKLAFRVFKDGRELEPHELPMQRAAAELRGIEEVLEFVRADGSRITVLLTASPIKDDTGAAQGAVGICVDVTRLRAAEEALRQANRRKDEFLAMLAHELRNPLAAVGNAVTLLKYANDPENVSFAKDVIDRQTKQLARLIDDLLDVSRITSGKIRLRRELVDAVPILLNAVESVTPLIEERKHQLITDLPGESLPLRADPTRIEQIVVNLLTNAAKYTESGGRIRLSAERTGDEIVITVEDNGMGIAPEKLPEMFELFSQGERSIARSEGGLGIGLTIVQKLVEMHGGCVTASSEGMGLGSTFRVVLPAARRPAPSKVESPTAIETRGARILVVDDNVDTARGTVRLLKLLGNDVRIAHDGPSAIDAARAFGPEFVLLDIGLPGMDGYEVATKLRDDPCCRTAVIVAVSGYGQDEDRRRSREAGFDHHLVKPVDFNVLAALLAHNG